MHNYVLFGVCVQDCLCLCTFCSNPLYWCYFYFLPIWIDTSSSSLFSSLILISIICSFVLFVFLSTWLLHSFFSYLIALMCVAYFLQNSFAVIFLLLLIVSVFCLSLCLFVIFLYNHLLFCTFSSGDVLLHVFCVDMFCGGGCLNFLSFVVYLTFWVWF